MAYIKFMQNLAGSKIICKMKVKVMSEKLGEPLKMKFKTVQY